MKKLFFLIAAVLVLSVPVFAEDEPLRFTSQLSANNVSSSTNISAYVFTPTSNNVYLFTWFDNSSHQNTEIGIYGIRLTSGSGDIDITITPISGDSYTTNFWNFNEVSGTDYSILTLPGADTGFTFDPNITPFPYGTTKEQIVEAFQGYLESPHPVPAAAGKFSVPCGNVAYFQVATSQTVNFKSVYQILSRPFASSTYGYWSDSGQRFGSASGLPTSSTSYPLASQSALYWTPDPQSKNLLGLSKTGLASASCSAGQWYAFYNPAYNSNNTDFTTMDITGATVSISGSFSAVKIYPLEQVVDYQNGAFVGSSNDGYTSYYDGTIGEDGNVTFTDQNGNAGTPIAGGQNLLAPNETYQSIIDKVVGLLQNIVSEIKNLFSFGYEAINDLAGLMSNFGRALSGLYSWLPSEVHAALISAVSIAIVIGVFKVFI